MNYKELCFKLFEDKADYYLRWYHSQPMLIDSNRRGELRRMHAILYKSIEFMAEHYREFVPAFMPLEDKVMDILDYQSRYPFKAGAYRPDYIISSRGELLLVEITCRFFGHGLWFNFPAELKAERFMAGFPDEKWESRYNDLMEYMRYYIPEGKDIFVFKSSDKTNEISLYQKFYEHFGHKVYILEAEEVESSRHLWEKDAFLISALNQRDLLSFSMDTIRAMIDAGMVNDMRTIFITHDKRFLSLLFEDSFTSRFLSPDDCSFIRSHTIKTYTKPFSPEEAHVWKDAIGHKDSYIIKPYDLGKSVGLHAGCMCDIHTWEEQFRPGTIEKMILQPFIGQKTYPVVWEGTRYDDYICGMMLCVDDRYFDSGMIRASSAPVSNVVDDRKIAVIHSNSKELEKHCHVL